MLSTTERSRNLNRLLRKLRRASEPQFPGENMPIAVLIMSFMLWESTISKALTAYSRLLANVVDFNDLRVSLPEDMAASIGVRYPLAAERCERLKATLRDIYMREHAVSLDRLNNVGKREVKKYMESLDGIVPYVSSRSMLFSFDTHAIPVDAQLREKLIAEEIVETEMDIPEITNWLGSQILAEEGISVHHKLQKWVDRSANRSTRRTRAARAG